MLLVVLGAGASFDSVHWNDVRSSQDYRPPLAVGLFDPRPNFGSVIDMYGACRPLVADLRDQVRAGHAVEAVLEERVAQAEGNELVAKRVLAVRYYLAAIIGECGRRWFDGANGITNYHRLVASVEDWRRSRSNERVAWVTFNYDRMLEDAMWDTSRFRLERPGHYLERIEHRVFKPHGSVDWGRVVANRDDASSLEEVIDRAATLSESDEVRVTSYQNFVSGSDWCVPALAVPTQTKARFQCPQDHVGALEEALALADKALIIGWAGGEQAFLRMWGARAHNDQRGVVVADTQEAAEGTRGRILELVSGRFVADGAAGFSAFAAEAAEALHGLD